MLSWERPAFDSPFEIWREDGVVYLVLAEGARVRLRDMKELLRLVAVMDPGGTAPVLMECRDRATVEDSARELLRRFCRTDGNPVALFTHDLDCRLQGEVFKRVQRPRFQFRVFGWRDEACRWVRERQQLAGLVPDRKTG